MAFRRTVRRFLDLPLRRKLLLSFVAVVGFGGIVTLVLGTRLEHRTIVSLAQAKVRHDLDAAWVVYNDRLGSIREFVRLSTDREFLQAALAAGSGEGIAARLDVLRRDADLDVLTLTDGRGRVLVRARRPDASGDDLASDPVVRRALAGDVAAGTQIVPREALLREAPELAERAFFRFIPTPMAADRPEDHEENGMMLLAAAPVRGPDGKVLGALRGGLLLNRDFDIVDRVKDVVFKGEMYKGKDIGTATIFQGDLRVSTNVLNDDGSRAVGTRVSREVNAAVLREGRPYIGRAFVVSHWYITAYEPIRDIDGGIVGMLYVGMLERPYIDLRNRVMATFAAMAGLCVVFLLGLLSVIAGNITRPLRSLVGAANKIAKGDLDHRVPVDTNDETGQLAGAFNRMTADLEAAREDLTLWGRMLEKRVEDRSRELRATQDQLIRSEKLASLGKMAAGVAHEINNPLTSILIQAHLMLERCAPDDPGRENVELIASETARCARIVNGLLEFARQTPAQTAPTNVNEIVDRTVQLVDMQAAVRNIRIVRELDPTLPLIELDKAKVQQVFQNLVINAMEAMPGGGTLTIISRRSSDGRDVEIVFADTGVGIPPENMTRLFDPFFTTKSGGTGLGLSVSYGIVQQSGGTIDVRSEIGRGSVFAVKFPLPAPASKPGPEEAPR